MNPDISAIVDLFYHIDNAHEGIQHLREELRGFGHAHAHDDHHHGHGPESGFNLRHLELAFSAAVDPYFRATAIAAIERDGAEIEVAEIETLGLPWGLRLKGGKFYSDFGYLNAKHAHEWDFVDQPMVFSLLLGDHGLNDTGLQLSWLAPLPFYLLAGTETFQGNNENAFDYHGDGPLSEQDGPRVFVGWVKLAPNLPGPHELLLGLAAGTGKHQEEHEGPSGDLDHWLDGDTTFQSASLAFKRFGRRPYGEGNLTVQGEYFRREKDIDLVRHDRRPDWVGNARVETQDGYYLQVVYGVLPRWRAGLRWEQIGLTNKTRLPNGNRLAFDDSHRVSAMLDFTPTEFSRIRFQVNHGSYDTDDGREDAWEGMVQWVVSLGAHGAHAY